MSEPANEGSSDEDVQEMTAGFGGFGIDPYRLATYRVFFAILSGSAQFCNKS